MGLDSKQVVKQSREAFSRWKMMWDRNADTVKGKKTGDIEELFNKGAGQGIVLCAFGPSLEARLPELKAALKDNPKLKVACVDKAFGPLMDRGVVPDYVMVQDARVPEKYFEGRDTTKTTLIANVCANPKWHELWQGPVYHIVNRDSIDTHFRYSKRAGVYNTTPAPSNVSNALAAFFSRVMRFRCLLIGFDYSWPEDCSRYYAFSTSDKAEWMATASVISPIDGTQQRTSGNLAYSCDWLQQFASAHDGILEIYNCSEAGIFAWERRKFKRELLRLKEGV